MKPNMASTKVIIATLPKSEQNTLQMLSSTRKLVTVDGKMILQPTNANMTKMSHSQPDTNPAPRKRQRLTHLSPEEKMMRRKLKNRVAAQTARDRKKAHMDSLEHTLEMTEAESKKIQMENALLRKQNAALAEENRQLKLRLAGQAGDERQSVVVLDHGYCMDSTSEKQLQVKREIESSEPAALTAPPQQELTQVLLGCLAVLLTWSLMNYLGFLVSSTRQQPKETSTSAPSSQEEPLCLVTKRRQDSPWWGPQQRSWNPSKN